MQGRPKRGSVFCLGMTYNFPNVMSKAAQCIHMIAILQSGRVYKREELARLLGTNLRNVGEYRKALLSAGEDVRSIPGKDGGYYLAMPSALPLPPLNEEETSALNEASALLSREGKTPLLQAEYAKEPANATQTEATLQDACAARRDVAFVYGGSEYNLSAHRLCVRDDKKYLLAKDEKNTYAFALSDISSATIGKTSPKTKEEGASLAIDPRTESLTFVTKKKRLAEIALLSEGRYFKARDVSANAVMVEMPFESGEDMDRFALSLGRRVAVLSPAHVIKAIRDYASYAEAAYAKEAEH